MRFSSGCWGAIPSVGRRFPLPDFEDPTRVLDGSKFFHFPVFLRHDPYQAATGIDDRRSASPGIRLSEELRRNDDRAVDGFDVVPFRATPGQSLSEERQPTMKTLSPGRKGSAPGF